MLTDARLGAAPAASLAEYVHAVQLNTELAAVGEFIDIDLAHVVMLAESGILDPPVAASLLGALLSISDADGRRQLRIDPARGSLLLQVEGFLAERCGAAGGMLQIARSRIDQSAEALRLVARRCAMETGAALLDLARAQLDAADRFDAEPVPGYTHGQHSQPTTLGHYLNAQYWSTSRDLARLGSCLERIDLCALGGAALSGTSWPIDRSRTATLLGHRSIVLNARDAGVFSLDVLAELAGTLAMAAGALGRVAGDLLFWCSSEVDLIEVDPSLCGTSSMMPQKRNPYALERIRAVAGESVGWQAQQLGLLRLATTTDGDLLFGSDATPAMTRSVVGAAALMRDVLDTLVVHTESMRRSAASRWSSASALADELVRNGGYSFRAAHEVIARLVRRSEQQGRAADQVGRQDLVAAAAEAGTTVPERVDIAAALDPDAFLRTRTSAGGTAETRRRELAELARSDLDHHAADHRQRLARHERARTELYSTARSLAVGSQERGNHVTPVAGRNDNGTERDTP